MLLTAPLRYFFKRINIPVSEKNLTEIDVAVTLLGILVTAIGIFIALQFSWGWSIVLGLASLGLILFAIVAYAKAQQVDAPKASPFQPWTPVTPPQFVGRTTELKKLADALVKNESLAIVGSYRIGKSSLLATWALSLQTQQRHVLQLSAEDSECQQLAAFINKITGKQGSDDADGAADQLQSWAAQFPQPPIILLDEADHIIETFPVQFFKRLRGLLGQIIWVFASRQNLNIAYQNKNHSTSPFENQIQLLYLKLLDQEAAETLRARVGSEELSQVMAYHAGGHPFYLQLCGRMLLSSPERSLDARLDDFQDEADKQLECLWQVLPEREQHALQKKLQGQPLATGRFLKQYALLDDEDELFGDVLKRWWRENKKG